MAKLDPTSNAATLATTLAGRQLLRQVAGAETYTPICLVEGDSAPRYVGEAHHYETRGGQRIYHPSAYSKRGWSSMVYVSSSLAVEVGCDWTPSEAGADAALSLAEYYTHKAA